MTRPYRTIYCDVDGVLADFVGGVRRAMALPEDWQPRQWDINADTLLTGREAECDAALREPGFCEDLHAYNGSVYQIQQLRQLRPVTFLTSPLSNAPCWISERRLWLEQRFPYADVIFEKDKAKYARHGVSSTSDVGAVLIDDSDAHCEAWRKAGGTAYLVARPWNSGSGGNLQHVLELIKAGAK